MINEEKLDGLLLELGHDDYSQGTALLREAVKDYNGQLLTKVLYPQIAKRRGTTAARVERNMRYSIEKAWSRCPYDVQIKWFGNSIDPQTGRPQVGEYVARLARICRDN